MVTAVGIQAGAAEPGRGAWPNGLPAGEDFFPIGVWLQQPANAARYREAGINLYVGLWKGPTEAQLAVLEKARMPVICAQTGFGLRQKHRSIIVGWMHDDEPDNAQSLGEGRGYGPPILPSRIVEDYGRMREADPTRPIFLNLGQGVAWDDYIGRGVRRNHPEDYPEYLRGCDIVSFDIYPVVHPSPVVAGRLEFVARGVERLVAWSQGTREVWNCIECTHISNPRVKATPAQVRSEVWMAIIRGSRGLIYFVHQFEPVFREAALLDDPEMLAAVTAINREIRDLAPVLNGPSVPGAASVTADPEGAPIGLLVKERDGRRYLFAVNLGPQTVRGTFHLAGGMTAEDVDVLGENRRLKIEAGRFVDGFEPYAVHRYVVSRSE